MRGESSRAATWEATQMGRAVYDSSLPLDEACALFHRLQAAQQRGLALPPDLELLFHLIQAGARAVH